jgi:PKD repeat protein
VYNSKDTYICTEIEVAFYQDFETDNETYIGADTIAGIEFYEEPLAYGIASVTFTLPPGQHTYTVVVDPDNLIDELNETNNIASSDEEYTNVPPVAKIHVNKDTVLTYEKIHFDASLSTDVDSPIWDYRWDFDPEQDAPDDGNPETTWDNDGIPDNDEDAWGMLVDHIYTDGTKVYTVTLIVTDIEGASDKTTIEITVYNRPPTLNYKIIKEDQIIFEKFDASSSEENEELIPIYIKPGVLLTFDASPSTDMDGTISTYTWDFDDGTIETTAIVEHAFEYERPYKVEITITDDDSVSVSDTILIIVENDPPIPVIRPIPSEVMTLVELTFSATDSYDLDGEIMNYTWDFGDNTIEYGVEVTHAYVDDGNYTINLTVTDNGGKTNFTTVNISVLNRAPIPALQVTPSTEVEINTELTFDASASMDLDGTLMYLFDFGDGNSTAWQTEPVATYIYTITGTYTVTLMVRDDDFAINTTAVELRIYKNQLPIAGDISYEPASPVIGEPVTFRAVGYYDPDKDGYVAKFKFDFGDGTDSGWITSSSTSHVYDEIGAYKVTLIVQDDKGGESVPVELTIIVNKSALPPSDEKDKRAVQPGVISGAVIGGIIAAVIVTIIIVMLLLLRRRRSRREKPPGEEELPQPVPQQRLPPRPISVTRLPPGEQRQPPQPPQPQPPTVYQMTQTPPQSPPVYQAPSISSRVRPPEQPP